MFKSFASFNDLLIFLLFPWLRVNSLLWDSSSSVLYLAGAFHTMNSKYLTPNLAMWSLAQGLSSFPGGNALSVQGDKKDNFEIIKIFMESIVSVRLFFSIVPWCIS